MSAVSHNTHILGGLYCNGDPSSMIDLRSIRFLQCLSVYPFPCYILQRSSSVVFKSKEVKVVSVHTAEFGDQIPLFFAEG